MGGLGGHHVHPYALQAAAFLFSLVLPGLVFLLLGGAFVERHIRNRTPAASHPDAQAPTFAFSRGK